MELKIRAMFFSGTGTTAKVTAAIADQMWWNMKDFAERAEDIDFTPKAAREQVYTFDEHDIVVFGVPVIAGRVPNVLLTFLDTLRGGGAMAVPIVLYGNRNFDDALIELRNILYAREFCPVAAGAFIGEHSFSDTLAAGRPDEDDMKTAWKFAARAVAKILDIAVKCKGDEGEISRMLRETGPVPVEGQDPIRPYYQPRDRKGTPINILKVIPKADETKCTQCGVCVTVCPMDSIKPEAPGIVDGICIKCCGCVKKCPENALYFDDPGYLYHKEELELEYGGVRREPALFF